MAKISLRQQIEEAKMAVASVKEFEIRASVGEFRADRMRAVVRTLEWLQENEADVLAFVAEKKREVDHG